MIKNSIFIGIVIGCAFGAPVLYQPNAHNIHEWLKGSKSQPVAFTVEPQQKITSRSSSSGTKVAIPADDRGHYQAEFKLNGRKLSALVDTGATYVAINRTMAARIGINITMQDMKYKVSTANGQALAAAAIIKEVAIGKIRVSNVPALVLEDKALDGLLMGMSFLKELERFGVENQTMILEQ
jgi:aspartyl protease family protein